MRIMIIGVADASRRMLFRGRCRFLPCMAAVMLILSASTGLRAENFDVYPFATPEEAARFDALTAELRCPKCQNQSIADSNAPIAQDLRARTHELMRAGRSDEEIIVYLTERYGEFVRYRPPLNAVTALLWIGPFLLLLLAVTVIVLRVRRRAGVSPTTLPTDAPENSIAGAAADTEKVRAILKRFVEPEPRS